MQGPDWVDGGCTRDWLELAVLSGGDCGFRCRGGQSDIRRFCGRENTTRSVFKYGLD